MSPLDNGEVIVTEEDGLIEEALNHFINGKSYHHIQEYYSKGVLKVAYKKFKILDNFYNGSIPCRELLDQDIIMYHFFDEFYKN